MFQQLPPVQQGRFHNVGTEKKMNATGEEKDNLKVVVCLSHTDMINTLLVKVVIVHA